VDSELQSLTEALVALRIGVRKTCAVLAAALAQKGVMCIDDLRLLPEAEARDLLESAGFEKIQQLKLMQAAAPALAVASRAEGLFAGDVVRKGAAQAAVSFCIPALSLRTDHQVLSDAKMVQWNTVVPGVAHPDVFAFDDGNASVVRVRVRGVYQLHVAVGLSSLGSDSCTRLHILVNGTLKCSGLYSVGCTTGGRSFVPMILFDILHLDADDAITVRPESSDLCGNGRVSNCPSNNTLENRFNLVLLQRL
jgi:hypothetical protein